MNKGVLIKELFDCEGLAVKDLFSSFTYPWEVLPHIGEFIAEYVKSCASGMTEIKSGVFVGENVKIHPSAVIEPPAVIGSGSELRPGAFIRGNVFVGENCVIGNSTELKNCILLNKVQVPHYNYVGDSILGNHSHMGAGSICSNLKSDGKAVVIRGDEDYNTGLRKVGAILGDGADIGCSCVLNPGTIVGKNTSVYPLNSLRGVFPSDSIVKSGDNVIPKEKRD